MLTPPSQASVPDLRKPSQSYVDNYIARRGDPSASPAVSAAPPASAPRGRMKRIFYQLEETCPPHYYPKLHEIDPQTMLFLRRLLLVRRTGPALHTSPAAAPCLRA